MENQSSINIMTIHHIALWTNNLEQLREFYCTYFDCKSNAKYRNQTKQFESYFLSFENGAKIEIMQKPGIPSNANDPIVQAIGITHLAIQVDSRQQVTELTERLRSGKYTIVSEPRQTGDGYFESCILDPDGNRIEIITQ